MYVYSCYFRPVCTRWVDSECVDMWVSRAWWVAATYLCSKPARGDRNGCNLWIMSRVLNLCNTLLFTAL